ncbi:6-phosphogluconolactonase [Shumkonia mesophila]|uniref:6-phosphogluconolactonase n=1 Tax=Shumkonia mesophila TaxID=2838854 RepID=UPI002934963B|nr:6-phosphogluconolactonase [Shumkonia mesophila]
MQTHRLAADRVVVAEGPTESVEAAARDIADTLSRRLTAQPTVSIALSGGTTPGPLYVRLAAAPYRHLIDWSRVQVFWCDERCVAPNDPASNYRLVTETLLADLPRMPEVHRMKGELPAGLAAQAYARELAEVFRGPLPWFDLVLLGMGGDGHVASLFPRSPQLVASRSVVATKSPLPPHLRISLTLKAINAAHEVVFLVHGGQKADIVAAILAGPEGDPARNYPAARVRPEGRLTWFLDRAAAGSLPAGAMIEQPRT